MDHGRETMRCTHSKAEDARLDRWTSVGYTNQVPGRACTKSALSILYRCKKSGRMPKDDFTFFSRKKVTSEIPEGWREVLLCVLQCCKVSTKLALAWSPFNMATKRRDVHGLIRLNIRCRETKSVAEALIMTNKRARGRCGFSQGGKPSKGVGRPTVPHIRKVIFLWKTWSVIGRWSRLRSGQDVKANLVVKEVAAIVSFVSLGIVWISAHVSGIWQRSATLVLPDLRVRWVRHQIVWSAFDGIGLVRFGESFHWNLNCGWNERIGRHSQESRFGRRKAWHDGHCGLPLPAGKSQSVSRTTCFMAYSPTVWVFGKDCQSPTVQKQTKKACGWHRRKLDCSAGNAQEVVEEGPPPREGQCMQNTVEANPPGSLCFVKSRCDLLGSHLQCSSFHVFFRSPVVFIGHRWGRTQRLEPVPCFAFIIGSATSWKASSLTRSWAEFLCVR